MTQISRRKFLKGAAATAAAATALAPGLLHAATTNHQVVVVGGGFAGATAAKYLAHWSSDVTVTLIEPKLTYHSPILSNLILNQNLDPARLSFSYAALANNHGINVVNESVTTIDTTLQRVTTNSGQSIAYDRLILAPGIRFQTIEGLDSTLIPHAWQGGDQVAMLRDQLQAMPAGGRFVMTIPAAPYRCPPGPYERACVVADWLQRNKPGATVTVLDANPGILVEPEIINHAFTSSYAGVVEYLPNATLTAVDSAGKVAVTALGDYPADVLNVIPPQEGGALIHEAGVANVGGRWAGVDPLSYESTAVANLHVIGDAQGTGQPKAGHIGNAEAKVCADAILRLLAGGTPYAEPMTNSACYTPISATTASWLTAVYAYNPTSRQMEVVPASAGAATAATSRNYSAMFHWANNLFADTFG